MHSLINVKIIFLLLLLSALLNFSCSSESSPENEKIISVVEGFFQAMAEHDTTLAASVLLPGAKFYSVQENNFKVQLNISVSEDFIHRVASSDDEWLERMWDPQVLVHRQIAVVWAPYDFYRNQKFSHGGVDVFNLMKTEEGWKIAGIMYTVELESSIASPLGAPVF